MIPLWLHVLSIVSLLLGGWCAIILAIDVCAHPQPMGIMNVVWPVTALFGTIGVVWHYYTYGRAADDIHAHHRMERHQEASGKPKIPFAAAVINSALHCGSGCTLGDMCAEWIAFFFPVVAIWFGWHSLFDQKIFAVWILDYILAFGFGILFQYFTIAPMRSLSMKDGIIAAVKADALSLTAWQVGMYGFMAVAYFGIFRSGFGVRLEADTVEFWFMMQIAMICGLVTAYPVNWWLILTGVKDMM